jgi:hypothetical protein
MTLTFEIYTTDGSQTLEINTTTTQYEFVVEQAISEYIFEVQVFQGPPGVPGYPSGGDIGDLLVRTPGGVGWEPLSYTHDQMIPALNWSVDHPLLRPITNVLIEDTTGRFGQAYWDVVSPTNILIKLGHSMAGKAHLST